MKYDVEFIVEIVNACCRLHNFLFDMQSPVLIFDSGSIAAVDPTSGVLVDQEL